MLRMLWQWYPSLWACALFWAGVFGVEVQYIRRTDKINWWTRIPILAGMSMNAAVTIANGGRMPVLGKFHPVSIWVTGAGKHLLFLCDRFDFHRWVIFSVGDFFILGALALGILLWLFRRLLPDPVGLKLLKNP
jgi:hypothetical protein